MYALPHDPLEIPAWLKRAPGTQRPKAQRRTVAPTKTDFIEVQLKDELPRVGSGSRWVKVEKIGRKWVTLITQSHERVRVSKTLWSTIRKIEEKNVTGTYDTMTSAQLRLAFNAMATELGEPTVKAMFHDRATGVRRCEELAAKMKARPVAGEVKKAPAVRTKKVAAPAADAAAGTYQWGARAGTNVARLLAALAFRPNENLPLSDLILATYGPKADVKAQVGPFVMVMKGAMLKATKAGKMIVKGKGQNGEAHYCLNA